MRFPPHISSFRDLSVRHKLLVLSTTTIAFALAVAAIALIAGEVFSFRQRLATERETLGQILAQNVSVSLYFDETGSAQEILNALQVDEGVLRASIFDLSGELFAEFIRKDVGTHPARIPDGTEHVFDDGFLFTYQPVRIEDEVIGTVCIQSSTSELSARLRLQVFTLAGSAVVAFLGSLLLSSRVRHAICNPVQQLATLALRVSSELDYSLRAEKSGADEVGTLVDAFNEMLEKVEMAEWELREARDLAESNAAEWRAASEQLEQESHERALAEEERDRLNVQLTQAQKLKAVGQLAAGIAHEINTPTQYVGDNTLFLQESFVGLVPLLAKATELADAVQSGAASSELADGLKDALEEADVEYLAEEIPRAIEQSLDGIARVRKIVLAMKQFSHPGADGMTELDLNHAIESTITVASNEWRFVAEMETDFDPELPRVPCLPGEFNQVVLNLIVNAAHAIADARGDGEEGLGTITISTRLEGAFAAVRIADTGTGIPEEVRERIFDPFFTTKEVGKGTGQGLSLAQGVIVQKHGGSLDFETEMGHGTTFIIRLPLEQKSAEPREVAA